MKIKKGDKVLVITGKDRGKEGVAERIFPRSRRVLLAGINIVKKHRKPRSTRDQGGIIEMAKPIDVSNVILICPKCSLRTRVGYQVTKAGRVRICKKCGQELQ